MANVTYWKSSFIVFLLCIAMASPAPAQTFTSLFSFDFTDGAELDGSLVQGLDGNLYGTTFSGGANVLGGTAFKITPKGQLTTIYNFCSENKCLDGTEPDAGLVLATDGNFYGTTKAGGGSNSGGTLFRLNAKGSLETLSLPGNPEAALIQATDGDLYGTTFDGGDGYGTVFKISPGDVVTTLHSFDGTDGANPSASLTQGTDGNFYGTTTTGGNSSCGCDGTIFKITPNGTFTTLYDFNESDGSRPDDNLVEGADGKFYGTTRDGGAYSDGTVFSITFEGVLTTLYSFCAQTNCTDGVNPFAGLVLATDGNFYGTTGGGGNRACSLGGGCGTIFKITPQGALTTLHSFDDTDGASPSGNLLQATDGKFYGTTFSGGTSGDGTIFSLSRGLFGFVKTLPGAGKAGAEVGILGTNLADAKGVSFNGEGAQFKVVSPSLILAYVPPGATTGKVEVTFQPAHYVYYSNVPFFVLK
jgi:uncharacterized repeat protein (TIGR03803 family)